MNKEKSFLADLSRRVTWYIHFSLQYSNIPKELNISNHTYKLIKEYDILVYNLKIALKKEYEEQKAEILKERNNVK